MRISPISPKIFAPAARKTLFLSFSGQARFARITFGRLRRPKSFNLEIRAGLRPTQTYLPPPHVPIVPRKKNKLRSAIRRGGALRGRAVVVE